MVRLKDYYTSDDLVRLASIGAIGVGVTFALWVVGSIASLPPAYNGGHGTQAAVITACYLPFYLRHLRYAVHGARPPAAGWTLAAMTVLIAGSAPVVGAGWLYTLHVLAATVLMTLRPRWSVPLFVALVVGATPWAMAIDYPGDEAVYISAVVAHRSLNVFVLVWLVVALRRLQSARVALAEEAVSGERLRIDRHLVRTVETELETIATTGAQATDLIDRGDPGAAERELRALVERSRRTLADARRTIRSYKQVSLVAELETSAALLQAAGIETRLDLPRGPLPETLDDSLRSSLRAATARLLRDDTARRCVIALAREDGRLRLECRADPGPAPAEETAA